MVEEEIQEAYPADKTGDSSLTSEERETVISWADDDRNEIFIYTIQQPMIRRLLRNPLFKCQRKAYNKAYKCFPGPISIEGMLPRKALTLRKKIRKLSPKQREQAVKRLKKARERQKPHVETED